MCHVCGESDPQFPSGYRIGLHYAVLCNFLLIAVSANAAALILVHAGLIASVTTIAGVILIAWPTPSSWGWGSWSGNDHCYHHQWGHYNQGISFLIIIVDLPHVWCCHHWRDIIPCPWQQVWLFGGCLFIMWALLPGPVVSWVSKCDCLPGVYSSCESYCLALWSVRLGCLMWQLAPLLDNLIQQHFLCECF